MKIKNRNLKTGHLCLIYLLSCVLPLGAQNPESSLKMPDSKGRAFPLFMSNQVLPSDQQLAETAVSLASFPPAESLSGDGIIAASDRNLLYVPPPDTGGGPLGTPVREAAPFLAVLVILYGIIFRFRNSTSKKTKEMEQFAKHQISPNPRHCEPLAAKQSRYGEKGRTRRFAPTIFKSSNLQIIFFLLLLSTPALHSQTIEWGTGGNVPSAQDINVGSSELSYIDFYFQVKDAPVTNMRITVVLPYTYEVFDRSSIQKVSGIDTTNTSVSGRTLTMNFGNVAQNSIVHYRIPRYSSTQPNAVYSNPSYNVTVTVYKNNTTSMVAKTLPYKYNYAKLYLTDMEAPLPANHQSPLGLQFGDNYENHATGYTGAQTFQFRMQCIDGKVDSATVTFTHLLGGVRLSNWRVGSTLLPDDQITTDTISGTTPRVSHVIKIRKTDFPSGAGISNGEYVPVSMDVIKVYCGTLYMDFLTRWGLSSSIRIASDINRTGTDGISFTASQGTGMTPLLEEVSHDWIFPNDKVCYDGSYSNIFTKAYANNGQGAAKNIRFEILPYDPRILIDTASIEIKVGANSAWESIEKFTVGSRLSLTDVNINPAYRGWPSTVYADVNQTVPAGDTIYMQYRFAWHKDYYIELSGINRATYTNNFAFRTGVAAYTDMCGENLKSVSNTIYYYVSSSTAAYQTGLHAYVTQVNFSEPDQVTIWSGRMIVNTLKKPTLYENGFKFVYQISLPKGIELAYSEKDSIKIYRYNNPPGTNKWPVRNLQTNATKDTITIELYRDDMTGKTIYDYAIEIPFKNACTTGEKSGNAQGEIRMSVYPTGSEGAGCNESKWELWIFPAFSYICEKEGISYTFDYKRLTVGLKDDDRDGNPDIPLTPADPDAISHNNWLMGDTTQLSWKGKAVSSGDTVLYVVLLSRGPYTRIAVNYPKELTLNGMSGQLQATLLNDVYASGVYAGYATPRDRGSGLTERYAYAWEITKPGNAEFTAGDSIAFIMDAIVVPAYANSNLASYQVNNWFYSSKTSRIKGLTTATAKIDSVLIPGDTRKGDESYPFNVGVYTPRISGQNSASTVQMNFSGIQEWTYNGFVMTYIEDMSSSPSFPYEYRHLATIDSIIIEVPEGYEIPDTMRFRLRYYRPSTSTAQYTSDTLLHAAPSGLPHRRVFVFGSSMFDVNRNDPDKWRLPTHLYYIEARPFRVFSTYAAPVGETRGSVTIYSDGNTYTTGANNIPMMTKESAGVDYSYYLNNLILRYVDLGSVKVSTNSPVAQDALSSEVSWEVNLQNTAADTAAYNAWLYVQGPVSNIKLQIGSTTYTGQGEEGRWIPLPTLEKGGIATTGTLTVDYASSDCSSQTVTLYPFYDRTKGEGTTWNPADDAGIALTNAGFSEAQMDADKKLFIYSKLNLIIRNVESRLSGSITPLASTPASPLHISGDLYGENRIAVNREFPLEIVISTFGAPGPVIDTRVQLNVPSGLQAVTDSAYIEINGVNYKITAANGNAFLSALAGLDGSAGARSVELKLSDIDLPALEGTRGELRGNNTDVYLRLKLKPTCDVDPSSPRITAGLSGKRLCGDDVVMAGTAPVSSWLELTGILSSLAPEIQVLAPTIATTDFICHQSDTLTVRFKVISNVNLSVATTDSLYISIPRALKLSGDIRYSLPAGSSGSGVAARVGVISAATEISEQEETVGGNRLRIISWPMPKDYFDALKGQGATGTAQAEYNVYKICLKMEEPEDYFDGDIHAGIITGASLGAGCNAISLRANAQPVAVVVRAPYTVWTGNTADWNLSSNWTNGVPGACTNAEIPASSTVFPVLSDTTIRVNSVHLPAGAEIGGIPYLNYDSAKVDLSITSNRWYLLSSPFMDMYSGDYILGSTRNNPAVYIRRYQSEDLWSGAAKKTASWTSSFGQTNILLTPGTGYAIWVATDENESQTFDFPKDSTSYAVYNRGGTSVAYTENIPSRVNSYRFAFYDKFSQNAGKNDRSFDLAVENGTDASYTNLLIANPFMSHLDFSAFYSANSSKIGTTFYVWNGNSFTATNQAPTEASGDYSNRYIAPQQSFVVLRNGSATFNNLRFTPAMSVANVGNSLRSAGSLRSTSSTQPSHLHLKVYRYGVLQSEAEIRYQPGASNGFEDASDAWTLFAEDVKKTAVLYSLVDNAAASINTLGNLNEDIALGIRTSEPGELKFEITGAESFDGDVYLIDVAKGEQAIELGTSTEYVFNNTTGDIIDRFHIRVLGTGTGISDETAGHGILIYQENSVLYVKSDLSDPLLGVSLFDPQGRLLLQHTAGTPGMASETSCALPIAGDERMVTVKVVSEKSQIVRKLFIK